MRNPALPCPAIYPDSQANRAHLILPPGSYYGDAVSAQLASSSQGSPHVAGWSQLRTCLLALCINLAAKVLGSRFYSIQGLVRAVMGKRCPHAPLQASEGCGIATPAP